jgi:lipopolysaccharide export system permease protein
MLGYIALQAPGHAYELMPLAVLIGGMVAMTQLASSSEYTVIRTCGITLGQIARTLLLFGLGFAFSPRRWASSSAPMRCSRPNA